MVLENTNAACVGAGRLARVGIQKPRTFRRQSEYLLPEPIACNPRWRQSECRIWRPALEPSLRLKNVSPTIGVKLRKNLPPTRV
jgi:hypothetical protein